MPEKFATGWSRDKFEAVAAKTVYANAYFADDRPLPPAFSLSGFRLRYMMQNAAGTCWAHAPVQAFEVMTGAQGDYEAVELSRMLVCWQGENIMGRGGNPSDGGSVSAAFLAMGDPPKGVGVCHAALWPYSDNRQALAASPPAGALADASPNRVHQVALAPIGSWQRLLFSGHPIAIGIAWSESWDAEGQTFFSRSNVSPGLGHALTVMGWMPHAGEVYWQLDNWHGLLYAPLPPDVAATVPGYKPIGKAPGRTSDFWVANSALAPLVADGEAVTASGVTGFVPRDITWSWDGQ